MMGLGFCLRWDDMRRGEQPGNPRIPIIRARPRTCLATYTLDIRHSTTTTTTNDRTIWAIYDMPNPKVACPRDLLYSLIQLMMYHEILVYHFRVTVALSSNQMDLVYMFASHVRAFSLVHRYRVLFNDGMEMSPTTCTRKQGTRRRSQSSDEDG